MPIYQQISKVPKFLQRHLDKVDYDPKLKQTHVAFAVKKGRLVSIGKNAYCSHAAQGRYAKKAGEPYKQFLHAEVAALIKSKGKCDSIYVVRITKSGELAMSMPCPVCQLAIQETGVSNVYFS